MLKKERALAAVELLKQKYPDAKCSLNYETPFQLLIATRLSAQCTDARVNMVTPALFKKYPTAEKLGNANLAEVENIIKTLIEKKNYDKVQTERLAPKIEALPEEIKEALNTWVESDKISEVEYNGYTVEKILK